MKRFLFSPLFILLLLSGLLFSCKKDTVQEPCNGKGTLNIENKLDSVITVKIVQTNTTRSIKKDYTQPFVLTGNQPYTLNIDGPNYNRDTTLMLLTCDNVLFVVIK